MSNTAFERVIISEGQIKERVDELAAIIAEDYAQKQPLFLVGILKGAFIFLADLSRKLTIPHAVDFMALSSYGKTARSGAVRILMDLREPIDGATSFWLKILLTRVIHLLTCMRR